jgi:flagellar hook assembly protein FlgD
MCANISSYHTSPRPTKTTSHSRPRNGAPAPWRPRSAGVLATGAILLPALAALLFLMPAWAIASTFNQIPASERSPFIYRLDKSATNHHIEVDLFALPYATAAYGVGNYDGDELVVGAIYQFTTDPSWDRVIFSKRRRVYPDTLKLDYVRCYGGHGTCDYGADVLDQPTGIAVAPSGEVYVADTNNNRIVVLRFDEAAGQLSFVRELTIAAPELPLNEPFGVSWDHHGTPFEYQDDYLWVADGGNHRLVKFHLSDGALSGVFDSFESCVPGEGTITLRYPQGVACARQYGHELDLRDPDCSLVFVADSGNRRILRLRECGGTPQAYCDGSFGYSLDSVIAPDLVPPDAWFANIDVDEYGSLYVPDQKNSRLYKLSESPSRKYPILPLKIYGVEGRGDSANTFFHPVATARLRARILDPDPGLFSRWMSIDEVYTVEQWTDDTGGTRHEVGIEAKVSYVDAYSNGVVFGSYHTENGIVSADVLNADSVLVKSIAADSTRGPNEWHVFWDGTDSYGNPVPQGDYIFRVTAEDAFTQRGVNPEISIADTAFSFPEPIEGVAVEAPNGGEVLLQGGMQTIAWDVDGLGPGTSVDILCSWDGGSEWEPIATGLDPTATSYDWTIGSPYHSESCLVKVKAYYRYVDEPQSRWKSDESDALFTICHAGAAFSGLSSVWEEEPSAGFNCICPAGHEGGFKEFWVTLKDCLGNPVAGVPAGDIIAVAREDTAGTEIVCTGTSVHADWPTNADGWTNLWIRRAGGCGDLALDFYAQGVLVGQDTVQVKSPDLNGDCVVDAADESLFIDYVMHNNPCADFDGGGIGQSDVDIFYSHYGEGKYHFCIHPLRSSATVNSSDPSCMVLCPKGDMDSFSILVEARNVRNQVFPYSAIPADRIWAEISPSGEMGSQFVCREDSLKAIADAPTYDPENTTITINSGGGSWGGQEWPLTIYIGGQQVGEWWGTVKSPDIDGSGIVDGTDCSLWSDDYYWCSVFMPPECRDGFSKSDFDCNGTVDDDDFSIMNPHYKHRCGASSYMLAEGQAQPASWTARDAEGIRSHLPNRVLDRFLAKELHPELRALLTHVRSMDEPDSLAIIGGEVQSATIDLPPQVTSMAQSVPNPFRGTATISYQVAAPGGHVKILIFDVAGRQVRTLVDKDLPPGFYNVGWDGRTDGGRKVSSGIYFYQMKAPGFTSHKRMMLVR